MDIVLNGVLIFTLLVVSALGILLINKNRTEREARNKAEKLNANLTNLDAKKNEFLSLATHQLRSPLTSIKWGLASLKDNFSKEIIDHLLITTEDLIGTVNDLLDISKIEQGGLVMKFEEFDLYDFIRRLVEEFRMSAESKDLKLIFEGDNKSCFVSADQNKIRQVFVNLIDNAIKYTAHGSVQVSFERSEKEAIVRVTDTGPGISKTELSQIFNKFLRGAAGKASEAGSGLGLYLAQKIVQLHKGSIEADSRGLGKGSVFTVKLPLKP